MNVMHLISGGDTGGARTHVHLLLKYLNMEHEATLVCFMRGPFSEDAAALGIPTVVIEKGLFPALRELQRMITERGVQVIHCHGSRGNLMGALLKRRCKLPVISTVHSDPKLDYLGRSAARMTYGVLNAWALRRMDYYVGVSDSMKKLLMSRGFDANRIFTIYNGVEFDTDESPVPGEREAYFRELGLQTDGKSVVVGIGARFDAVKDVATLLRGFAIAWRTHPCLRLLVAGDGQERAMLENLARELGIREAVCFAGWVTDMRRFYRCIDINTLTSLSETFPYAVTEGARAGKPIVSTRVGGIPMLVQHGKTGFLVEPGDAQELGRCLGLLAEDPKLRKELGEALYQKASNEFSAAATARRQVEIYEQILAARSRERYGVVICGAYGMRNAGDEAVLDAILADMREIDPAMPLTVLSRNPRDTMENHSVKALHSFNVPGYRRAMKRSELYINGGGSLVQDITSSRNIWYYLNSMRAAKKLGCKVMMYGCGVGPVLRERNRRLAGRIISRYVDAITLRERHSLRVLRELGVSGPEITVASEPALSLESAPESQINALMRRCSLNPEKRYFCICIRKWQGMKQALPLFARAADNAWYRHGLTPLLLSVNPRQDEDLVRQLRELVKVPCALVEESMTSGELIGFISRMTVVMAMRLHPLIFSTSQSVPSIGISYDPKVAAFLDYIGHHEYIQFDEIKSAEQLDVLLDRALRTDRSLLREATERIRTVEQRNAETARKLLGR